MLVGQDVAVGGQNEAGARRSGGRGLTEEVVAGDLGGDADRGIDVLLIDLGGGHQRAGLNACGFDGGTLCAGYQDRCGAGRRRGSGSGLGAVSHRQHAACADHAAKHGADQAQGDDALAEAVGLFPLLLLFGNGPGIRSLRCRALGIPAVGVSVRVKLRLVDVRLRLIGLGRLRVHRLARRLARRSFAGGVLQFVPIEGIHIESTPLQLHFLFTLAL